MNIQVCGSTRIIGASLPWQTRQDAQMGEVMNDPDTHQGFSWWFDLAHACVAALAEKWLCCHPPSSDNNCLSLLWPHSQTSPVFVLQFVFGITHGSEEWRKTGKPGNTYHVMLTQPEVLIWMWTPLSLHPPGVIHMISVSRPFSFFTALPLNYTEKGTRLSYLLHINLLGKDVVGLLLIWLFP